MAIPQVLRSLGVDPAPLLAELGLAPDLFDNADKLMSYANRGQLLARCVDTTGCPHFGLLVGQHGGLGSLGLVGLLVKYSPDVGTALQSLVRYLHLHVRGATSSLEVRAELALLSYDIHGPHVEGTSQTGDGAVATMFNILRALCGPSWNAAEIQLAHQSPADPGPFRRFFQAPLLFDAERYGVVFASRWLKQPLPGSDAEVRRLIQEQIDALEARYGDQFPEQVRSVLRSALLTGHARADQVAAMFSIHSRTLARRLEDFGTSFQALVDEERYAISRQMLQNTDLPVGQVAASLDYADASAFTRAFRRWSGTTPAHWRDEQRRAMQAQRGR